LQNGNLLTELSGLKLAELAAINSLNSLWKNLETIELHLFKTGRERY
jgi:hypothetical protein